MLHHFWEEIKKFKNTEPSTFTCRKASPISWNQTEHSSGSLYVCFWTQQLKIFHFLFLLTKHLRGLAPLADNAHALRKLARKAEAGHHPPDCFHKIAWPRDRATQFWSTRIMAIFVSCSHYCKYKYIFLDLIISVLANQLALGRETPGLRAEDCKRWWPSILPSLHCHWLPH